MLLLAVSCLSAAEFYVSPTGSPSGNGSIGSPWDLQTVFNHPSAVRPGDTIWLRGGAYRGSFRSTLAGTASAPIVVRRYQNERAVLDGAAPASATVAMHPALTVVGPHTWYWGFEVTNTHANRVFNNSQCWERQHCRAAAVNVFGAGVKIINLIIHDTGDGIGLWESAVGAEVYGSIIYYAGWQSEVRGSGHGIYAQNSNGLKRITDNVILDGFHSGIHVYGSSSSSLRNIAIEGNTILQNGLLAADPNGWGVLVGGNVLAHDITINANTFFNPASYFRSSNINPSWGQYGTTRLTLTNNTSIGYRPLEWNTPPTASTIAGNLFAGSLNDTAIRYVSLTQNQVVGSTPAAPIVSLRRNSYEPNRSLISISNGAQSATVPVNVTGVLSAGDSFVVRDIQNYFGAPILSGVYGGGPIQIPMGNRTKSPVIGNTPRAPVHTGLLFGVFLLERSGTSSSAPAPPPAPAPDLAPAPDPVVCVVDSPCQAESAASLAAPMTILSSSDAMDGRYVASAVANQGAATFTFNVTTPQLLSVWLRMLAPNRSTDSVYLSLNGGHDLHFALDGNWSNYFQWHPVRPAGSSPQTPPLYIELGPGRHTLRVRAAEPGVGIDAVRLLRRNR